MTQIKFVFGDSVRHARRPEWGVGSIVKVEDMATNGDASQRLSVRFSNAGLKKLNADKAELEIVDDASGSDSSTSHSSIRELDRMSESEWLAPHAQKKIEALMVSMPSEIQDVFNCLRYRLEFMLNLYRFDRSGRGLIDWAVAQSGLDDPLSRFNRHVLEGLFDRWAKERDICLGKLIKDAHKQPDLLKSVLVDVLPAARAAFNRLSHAR